MKTFSPAGMATKGLFGYDRTTGVGAKSFGNPAGAISGGGAFGGGASPNGPNQGGATGSGIPVPQFRRVDGGVFQPTDQLFNLQSAGAFAVAYSQNDNFLGASSDSGLTWARVTVPAVTQLTSIVAGRADGTFVGNGDFTTIITSTDGGLTWTDTTPAGSSPTEVVLYSVPFDLFFFTDNAAAQMWTSPDGLVWTAQPMATLGFQPQTSVDGAAYTVAFGLGTPQDEIWRTTDGTTWTRALVVPNADGVYVTQRSAIARGATVQCLLADTGNQLVRFYSSGDSGATWVNTASGDGLTLAPYESSLADFQSVTINATSLNNNLIVATTPDGASFTNSIINTPDYGGIFEIRTSADGLTLYAYGEGVASCTTFGRWGTALRVSLTQGNTNAMAVGPGYALTAGNAQDGSPAIWRTP